MANMGMKILKVGDLFITSDQQLIRITKIETAYYHFYDTIIGEGPRAPAQNPSFVRGSDFFWALRPLEEFKSIWDQRKIFMGVFEGKFRSQL
jgi:hypothetical protein